eukprot:scaffold228749_cov17-Prasinocladus_malaysianus.AAC.1
MTRSTRDVVSAAENRYHLARVIVTEARSRGSSRARDLLYPLGGALTDVLYCAGDTFGPKTTAIIVFARHFLLEGCWGRRDMPSRLTTISLA